MPKIRIKTPTDTNIMATSIRSWRQAKVSMCSLIFKAMNGFDPAKGTQPILVESYYFEESCERTQMEEESSFH